jgi:Tol biopolymer transport system component
MTIQTWFAAAPRAVVLLIILLPCGMLAACAMAADLVVPDATRNGLIAYDHQGDIWVVEPDGSNPRPFVTDPLIDFDPTWSPDGTHMAFWALDPLPIPPEHISSAVIAASIQAGTAALVVVDANGADRQVLADGLTLDPSAKPMSWAPDGRSLVYGHLIDDGPDGAVIDAIALDGGAPRRLVDGGIWPTWSPDGRSIAYVGAQDDGTAGNGVYVLDIEGGVPRRISSHPGPWNIDPTFPQWSPESQRRTFSPIPSPTDIWVRAGRWQRRPGHRRDEPQRWTP